MHDLISVEVKHAVQELGGKKGRSDIPKAASDRSLRIKRAYKLSSLPYLLGETLDVIWCESITLLKQIGKVTIAVLEHHEDTGGHIIFALCIVDSDTDNNQKPIRRLSIS